MYFYYHFLPLNNDRLNPDSNRPFFISVRNYDSHLRAWGTCDNYTTIMNNSVLKEFIYIVTESYALPGGTSTSSWREATVDWEAHEMAFISELSSVHSMHLALS